MTSEKIREYLWWFLLHNDQAVEKVIAELYRQQTNDEKNYHITCHRNSRGFSAAHAKIGSYLAERIERGQPLTQVQLDQARRIAMHYSGQASSWLNYVDIGLPDFILKEYKEANAA